MLSRRESFQRIQEIPSKKGRIEAGIGIGLFDPEDILPITISQNKPYLLPDLLIQKIQSAMERHPIMESLNISPDQIQLPPQIAELSGLPGDFIALLEPIYASRVVEEVERRRSSPIFQIKLLRRIAQENIIVGAHNLQMTVLQRVTELRLSSIENGMKSKVRALFGEVGRDRGYVLNGKAMMIEQIAREEEIQQNIASFHDQATLVSGLIGRTAGELTCYSLRVGGEVIWMIEYWSARAVKAGVVAVANGVKKALNRT